MVVAFLSVEVSYFAIENTEPVTDYEQLTASSNRQDYAYIGEPVQHPGVRLFTQRSSGGKFQIKSLTKFFRLKNFCIIRLRAVYMVRSYYLCNQYIPQNHSLSQLQKFII